MGAAKLLTAAGGGVTLDAASTATDKTLTVPADNGTLVYANTSGNVGIGIATPTALLDVYKALQGGSSTFRAHGPAGQILWANGGASTSYLDSDTTIFRQSAATGNAERARIDSSGNWLVGTTSTSNPGGVTGTHSFKTSSSSKWAGAFENAASSSPWGVGVTYTGAAPNGTSNAFFYGTDTGGDRFFLRSNGGLANYSANNANLSDERTKTDIVDAGSYLAKICAIPVRTFKYKDQTDDLLNLGVIAQEVEAVAPELVDVSGFGATPEDGVPLKAIYQTDLQYALMKCIQEQQALITTLTERITALEGTQQ
jgi:hypothetical protein